jgi:uncharacterized protein (TIGR02145 family)
VGDFGVAGCWMTENLADTTNAGTYKYNALGTNADEKLYCYPYNSKKATDTLGVSYTWAALTQLSSNSGDYTYPTQAPVVQGLCPKGFHVPDDVDWTTLFVTIVNDTTGRWSSSNAAGTVLDINLGSMNANIIVNLSGQLWSTRLGGTSRAYNAPSIQNRGIAVAGGYTRDTNNKFDLDSRLLSRSSRNASTSIQYQPTLTIVSRQNWPKNNLFAARCMKDR